jgi:hypothetical protein
VTKAARDLDKLLNGIVGLNGGTNRKSTRTSARPAELRVAIADAEKLAKPQPRGRPKKRGNS